VILTNEGFGHVVTVGRPPTPLSAAFFVLRMSTLEASSSGFIGGSGSPGLSSVCLLLDEDDGFDDDIVSLPFKVLSVLRRLLVKGSFEI
jgi:hypothetical protein